MLLALYLVVAPAPAPNNAAALEPWRPQPDASAETRANEPSTTPPAAPQAPTPTPPTPPASASATPPAAPPAEPTPAADEPWAVGGFVDTQYIFNSNLPDNHIMRGTAVTSRTGEFNPNLVVAYVRRDPLRSPWMMEIALQAGSSADALYYDEPVAGGPNGRYAGVEAFKHIGRAWAGVKLRGGTEFAAGLMLAPTHFGSFWAKDNWHSSITWGYSSVPFFLAGARIYQPLGDRVGLGLWIADAYGYMGDNNKVPSGLLNLVIFAAPNLTLTQNVYGGPEDVNLRPEAWRLLLDSQIVYSTDKWGLAIVGDYGREKLTFKEGSPVAHWTNGMISVRRHVVAFGRKKQHSYGIAARPEFFLDYGGRIFNAQDQVNWLYGVTFTNDLRFFDAVRIRVEYRYDHSSAPSGFFYRGAAIANDAAGLASDQHAVIFNFIGYFERRLPGLRP